MNTKALLVVDVQEEYIQKYEDRADNFIYIIGKVDKDSRAGCPHPAGHRFDGAASPRLRSHRKKERAPKDGLAWRHTRPGP